MDCKWVTDNKNNHKSRCSFARCMLVAGYVHIVIQIVIQFIIIIKLIITINSNEK